MLFVLEQLAQAYASGTGAVVYGLALLLPLGCWWIVWLRVAAPTRDDKPQSLRDGSGVWPIAVLFVRVKLSAASSKGVQQGKPSVSCTSYIGIDGTYRMGWDMFTPKVFAAMLKGWIEPKLVLVIGIALGVSFLISNGPLLQVTLIALFDVSQASLYESVIPGGIALDRGLKPWVLEAFEFQWLVTAMAVALVTAQMDSWRRMVMAMGVAVTLGLTALDVTYGIMYRQVTAESLVVNVSANILGAISISAVFFLVLWTSLFVGKALGFHRKHRDMVTGILAATFGSGISLILYVATAAVLQPIEVHARVVAKLPTKGVVGKKYAGEEDPEERSAFRFISDRTAVEYVGLRGTKGVDWEWNRADEHTRFGVTVYVVEECFEIEHAKRLSHSGAVVKIDDAERLRITVDGFVSQFALEGTQLGVSVDRGGVSQFWLGANNEGKGVDLTEFVADRVVRGRTRGDVAVLLAAPPGRYVDDEDVVRRTPLTFRLEVDDETIPLVFHPKTDINDDDKFTCKSVESSARATAENTYEDVVMAGLYVEIVRTQVPGKYWASSDGKYQFRKAAGWFRRKGIRHDDLRSGVSTELGMIVIETPIDELFVDGRPYEVPRRAGFRGHGKIRATYDEASGFIFSGTFHAAWLERQRLNRTQWERWTMEIKITILTAMVSIGAGIATVVYRTRSIWSPYA